LLCVTVSFEEVDLYRSIARAAKPHALVVTGSVGDILWHERYGCLDYFYCGLLNKHMKLYGFPDIQREKGACEALLIKDHREKFHKEVAWWEKQSFKVGG